MIKIKVIGIGGSGGNTLLRMKRSKIKGVELVAINTDYQDLKKTHADFKLRIGKRITQGLGTGMKPEIGKAAALESKEEITKILVGTDMVFLTGGLGGGTCSGASEVVAEIAKNLGILTVGIFTLPFSFEGLSRRKIALESRELLKGKVDSLITIENDKLFEILDPNTKISDAFLFCDNVLREAVKGISDLITSPGIIDINFADIKSILKDSGTAIFGIGRGEGEKRGEVAAKMALTSPLLSLNPKGAKGILFNVSGPDISLSEIEQIGKFLTKEIHSEAKIIFGAVEDKKMKKGEIKIMLIATGF